MYLNFDENRPDTPRVPQAFTRLERVLLVVVAYQALVVAYLLAPAAWTEPVRQMLNEDEPLKFVVAQPVIAPPAAPKLAPAPQPAPPAPAPPQPAPPRPQAPEFVPGLQPVPAPEPSRRVTAPELQEPPVAARRVPGGILGSALGELSRLSQEAPPPAPSMTPSDDGPAIQFDTKGVDFGPWLRRFRAQVYRNWLIPQAAQVMKGHVVIQLVVQRSGMLTSIRVVRPSGIDAFDSAAVSALKMSNPTVRLPDEYPGNSIDPFTVIFYYNERPR